MEDALIEFARRVEDDLLPGYCAARGYSIKGFRPESLEQLTPSDAHDCLRAVNGGLFERSSRETFFMARSRAQEVLFTEGWKSKVPRPITLWLEPVITFAAIARLHFEFKWPKELLATQPRTWAFDLCAFQSNDSEQQHILGEVKKRQGN